MKPPPIKNFSSNSPLILCGPTASGKTALGLELAGRMDAEIVSADSGQVYRGMDVGTAKPSVVDQEKVRFHLIDIVNPNEIFSASEFRRQAETALEEIRSRGRQALIVGGTGLYLKALESGLFEGPSRDDVLREKMEAQVQERGIESLHEELKKIDPEAAKAIPSRNRHRLIRALEVFYLTGRPISAFWKEHQQRRGAINCAPPWTKFGLLLTKEEIHQRINERVEDMFEKGLVEEVENLFKQWGQSAPGLKIIGYQETIGCLDGRWSLAEAKEKIKTHTRQYAKRQMTWFKKDLEIRWVRPEEVESVLKKSCHL